MTLAEPLACNESSRALGCQQWLGIPKASAIPEEELPEAAYCRGDKP